MGGGDVLIWQVVDVLDRVVQEQVQETSKDSEGNIIYHTNEDGTPKMIWVDKKDENGNVVREVIGRTNVDGVPIKNFLSMNSVDDDTHWPVARVRVTGSGLSEPTYLDTYLDAYNTWPGNEGMYLGDVLDDQTGEIKGWGNPWTQSEIPSELGQELLFAIEIGEITWD